MGERLEEKSNKIENVDGKIWNFFLERLDFFCLSAIPLSLNVLQLLGSTFHMVSTPTFFFIFLEIGWRNERSSFKFMVLKNYSLFCLRSDCQHKKYGNIHEG